MNKTSLDWLNICWAGVGHGGSEDEFLIMDTMMSDGERRLVVEIGYKYARNIFGQGQR